MRVALAFIVLALGLAQAPAVEVSGKVLILTDTELESLKQCNGGCHLLDEESLRALLKRYYEQGQEAGRKEEKGDCWANTKGRV